jgi:hypothetical protein
LAFSASCSKPGVSKQPCPAMRMRKLDSKTAQVMSNLKSRIPKEQPGS